MTAHQTAARTRGTVSSGGAGFNEEARQAVNGAFDALSDWRQELSELAERHSSVVFDKMASAAKAVGWPTDFVEATRAQMESAAKLQVQIIDQVMDVWEDQLKSPGKSFPIPNAGVVMERLKEIPGFGASGQFPGMPDFSSMAMNPMQFWMQAAQAGKFPGMPDMSTLSSNPMQFWMQTAELWQKNWASAISSWMEMQGKLTPRTNGGSRPSSRS